MLLESNVGQIESPGCSDRFGLPEAPSSLLLVTFYRLVHFRLRWQIDLLIGTFPEPTTRLIKQKGIHENYIADQNQKVLFGLATIAS